ncbi:signal peptidase I [Faecalibaculum rodentium]|jgi:signal peptidase I|uniref:Signal peptidase I n=1 Tax=Faecalibaculum rodentium TaxID=1702221 RepID=A0A140DWU7_9FIRM|nr:signal peptidase I [Faecalibaculum rodentium]AMK55124.1 signal peptidase I [Faecalibaculum rodentium]OLU44241.1 signal peptidase I [Faecalibaculum rodentium]
MAKKKKKKILKHQTEYRYNEEDEKTIFEEILGFVGTFLICSVVIILVTSLIIKPNVVSGRSMYPALQTDDRGFSNVLALATEGVERGDIVTANMVNEEDGKTYSVVKRVIGLPGETIECRDEKVCINGKELDESQYLDESFAKEWYNTNGYFNDSFGPVTLKEDEYFLMGDNRPISMDSRETGPVKKEDILAKDFMVLFPFSRFGYHE